MPEFTEHWWRNNQFIFEELGRISFSKDKPPIQALEIGSYEGMSTVWFLDNWLTHPASSIVCIDTWQGGREHVGIDFSQVEGRFDENIKPYGSKANKLKAQSSVALQYLAYHNYRADFIYVDGSHEAANVLQDLVLAFHILKPQGLMVCDDYVWAPPTGDKLDCPKLAIDAFTTCYSKYLQIIHDIPNRVMAWTKK